MEIRSLDHVNLYTPDPDGLAAWYVEVLGLAIGWRPPFGIGGHWIYAGDRPIIHLVEVAEAPRNIEPGIEHFALSATGLPELQSRLDARGIAYSIDPVVGLDVVQVNLRDPQGNHIHVDFDLAEVGRARG
ncbi:VOC family protein [Roseisalinus antarcticus]|uniref:Glyoxalase-like domain protein n=1 Tax=Roseisalinus antarcticus TaxID=254357 RepID=A0A1Y5TQN3_9RHOB|nr:VOC family protein [Roseisalinus antarcticus]SLN65941.1 Glyoxalase-like domain protein [Roseisalinus antarcticus]